MKTILVGILLSLECLACISSGGNAAICGRSNVSLPGVAPTPPPPAYFPSSIAGHMYSFDDVISTSGTTWVEKGDTATDAVQATSGNRPTYHATAVAGKPALRFDGVDDRMTFTTNAETIGQFTWFIVSQPVVAGNGSYAILFGNQSSQYTILLYELLNGAYPALNAWSSNQTTNIGTYSCTGAGAAQKYKAGEPNVVVITYNAPVLRAWIGNTLCAINSNFPSHKQGTAFTMGMQSGFTALNGYIAEIHGYSVGLGTTEMTAMFNYLTTKYPKP